MTDQETGSWWQQISGQAILGPLKGKQLKAVPHDELSFAIWKREEPNSRVLRPVQKIEYAPENWEERIQKLPVQIRTTDLPPRTLIVGIVLNHSSKAYPFATLQQQSPIMDTLGGVPILIVLGDDRRSVRVFERRVKGRTLEFFAKPESNSLSLIDSTSGSEWDFTGKAINGPLKGEVLKKIPNMKDFWFDWKPYHPDTHLYRLGEKRQS